MTAIALADGLWLLCCAVLILIPAFHAYYKAK